MSDRMSDIEQYAIECLESAAAEFDGPPTGPDARRHEPLLAIAAYLSAIHQELKRANDLQEKAS